MTAIFFDQEIAIKSSGKQSQATPAKGWARPRPHLKPWEAVAYSRLAMAVIVQAIWDTRGNDERVKAEALEWLRLVAPDWLNTDIDRAAWRAWVAQGCPMSQRRLKTIKGRTYSREIRGQPDQPRQSWNDDIEGPTEQALAEIEAEAAKGAE